MVEEQNWQWLARIEAGSLPHQQQSQSCKISLRVLSCYPILIPIEITAQFAKVAVRCLSYEWDSEILADLPGELVVDLSVTGDRRASVLLWVAPP